MHNSVELSKNKIGTTLIEVVLCVGIISIILSIALPSRQAILTFRERKELMELKNDINYIRNKAICDMMRCSIKFFPQKNAYNIYKYESSQELIAKKQFKSSMKIEKVNFCEGLEDYYGELMFTETGAPRRGGRIILRNGRNEKIVITVEPATGKVNIYFNEE